MSAPQQGTVIAGKYRLEERLAGGGMGSVWKGHDERLDMPVAVKFMLAKLAQDPKLRARFEREAKSAAQIRSPHVVHMYDHGIEDGTPYLVMEFLDGEDLNQRLKRTGPLPLGEVKRICTEMCKGLHRAHQLGIIHRDLKPANVFLSAPDDDLVKLLDFGIAKASGIKPVGGETTGTDQLLGSPHYLSPEQVRGGTLDARSDLWAVAIIVYRMLTGQRAIEGEDLGDLCVRICTDPIAPPSAHRAGLDSRIDRFFERAFEREPDGRFQSAKEFAAAFSAVVRTVPTDGAARTPSSDDSSSWDPSTSDLVEGGPPRSARTQLAAARPSGGETLATPISASRSLVELPLHTRRWALWGGAVVVLLLGGGVVAFATMGGSSEAAGPDELGGGLPGPAASVETISGVAAHADESIAEGEDAGDPGATASTASAGSGDVATPPPVTRKPTKPIVRSRATTPPRPAPSPKPAPTRAGDPDDIGLGY